MKKSIIAISAFALSSILVGCGSGNQNNVPVEVKLPLVKTTTVNADEVAQQAEFTGSVEPFVRNNISPSMGLRIDKIHVEVGDRVKKGQLLVEMDKRQYFQSAVQLANLEADYVRMEKLFQEGGISKQQLDQLETQLKVSRHATENLRENADLISPINGIVTERMFDPGDMYSIGTGRIVTVMQMDKLKVMANISEMYFPHVKLGMPVDIKLDIYPGEDFVGKVSLIYPAIDATTRTFQVEITIANPALKLRPGMMCRTTLAFGSENHVLVPDISVLKQTGSSERYLFVFNQAENTVERRSVEIGRLIGSNYEIISGVKDGEQVVIAGMQKLLDGDKVQIVK